MKTHHSFIILFLLSSCVSVELPKDRGQKAENIFFTEPKNHFSSVKETLSDKAWISRKTGNTISFISECHLKNEPTLQQIENENLTALSKVSIIKSEEIKFNQRAGLESDIQGELDGIPVRVKSYIFKKNGCIFSLTYSGVIKKFDAEISEFENFKESFKVP